METDLKKLSLTGRLCYLFMCMEQYLTTCYPERDWTPVAERFWQWTNVYWNEGCDIYSAVVPEILFEFNDYKEANIQNFEGELSKKDYLTLINLYAGLTAGSSGDELNQVLMLPVEFNNECECTDFCYADNPTLVILQKMQQVLSLHNIAMPDISKVQDLTAEQKNGWGFFMDSGYLSVIIKS